MAEYNIRLKWQRDASVDFDYKTYNRKHTVFFFGGPKIEISSNPHLHRNPRFNSPEELFIASIASSYMLTFLSVAAKDNIIIDEYLDSATCLLNNLDDSKQAITEIILHPAIVFHTGHQPNKNVIKQLINSAKELCFIINSINANISVCPECTEIKSEKK